MRLPQYVLAVVVIGTLGTGSLRAQAPASPVADAVMRGDAAALRMLLEASADVNAPQVDGATGLHWAVYRGDEEAADLLLEAGARPDAANRLGVTPLQMATLYGHAGLVDRLLRAGADAMALGPSGETLVMLAARNGSPDVIRRLVQAGVDVNAIEPLRGTTALMWAVEQRHPEAVAVLLEAGADPSARSGAAGTPRNYLAPRVNTRAVEDAQRRRVRALEAGRTYEEQLDFEQRNGQFAGARNAFARPPAPAPEDGTAEDAGDTPPATAGRGGRGGRGGRAGGQGARAGGPGGAAGGQGGAPGGAGRPPAAAPPEDTGDDPVVVAGLVGSSGGGLTPLVFAAREGDIESARLLLDAGADVDETTFYGWTPLLTAVNNRNYRLAELLIDRGADVNRANSGGWTPLYLATDNRNIEGGDYPVPKADMDHLALIRRLLDAGADPNMPVTENTLTRTIFTMQWFYEDGATAFVRASQSSDTELMQLLLDHGADPHVVTANGDNALTAAAGIGWVDGVTYERSPAQNVEAIRMLLDLGLDPNHANNEGRTPLMGAALKGRTGVIELLVDRGARLDTRDRGSRDTHIPGATIAGVTFQAVDYADGLVRVGVQSAVERPEAGALLREMMTARNLPVPDPDRSLQSICVVPLCMGAAAPPEGPAEPPAQ